MHRSPKLAAPTLLVVGEVVRFADPVVLARSLGPPAISADMSPLERRRMVSVIVAIGCDTPAIIMKPMATHNKAASVTVAMIHS